MPLKKKGLINWVLRNKKKTAIIGGSLIAALIVTAINFLYFTHNATIFQVLGSLAVFLSLGPPLATSYSEYSRAREIENIFPLYITDVVDGVRAGMTLPIAMKAAAKHDYGKLNKSVRQMSAQMDWGVPFDDVLRAFSESAGTPLIKRTVATIIETHRSGGNIVEVLQAISGAILEVNKIKSERASHIYGQMITGYTIFFVFLAVLIGLQKFLLPSLSGLGGSLEGGLSSNTNAALYDLMFASMIIIQGTFSGLAIGKMAEGSLFGGLKHSVALVSIGYGAWVAAGAFVV
ncbi:MAG: type II secretion system F family protein [Candidatus Aenigmarchaeota archaeon]|nr:type II secretion system F family protein [Candidatus Aenigmarchaeota archaeon]